MNYMYIDIWFVQVNDWTEHKNDSKNGNTTKQKMAWCVFPFILSGQPCVLRAIMKKDLP